MAQLNDLLVMGQSTLLGPLTIKGLLTINTGSSNTGILAGSTYINAIDEQIIFQNNGAIRFGGPSWDWNNWAGLKYVHSSKTIYLGLADGTIFNANTAQSGGTLQFPGIATVKANGEVQAISANAFRAVYGNYGVFLRNDGSNTYFLITASGDQYGSWNTLRPFYFNNENGNVTMGHNVSIGGTLSTTGATTLSSTLGVTGNTSIGGTLGVTGATTLNSTLSVTGNASIGGTLGVTGTVTITKATDAATTANNGPALIVGGAATSTHIEIDCNEVLAKSNGTTETDLYLGTTTSKVHIGQDNKGSTSQPVYLNAGVITLGSTYAGGTKVTLNGADKGASTASFYAPTSVGTAGQVLTSSGSGAPIWGEAASQTISDAVGGAYVLGRDSALVKTTASSADSKYMSVVSCKTQLGEFSYGAIHPYEQLEWIYTTDTGYGKSDNTGLSSDNKSGGYRRVFSISNAGRATAISFNASSDRRLKTNITPFISQKSILDLPLYRFDFINGLTNQIGCMAQDLKEICPDLVTEDSNDGYLTIQESKIVYLLIDEIKQLKRTVEELKYGNRIL